MAIEVTIKNGTMDLSRVLTHLQTGQEVVLIQAGQPVARVLLPKFDTVNEQTPMNSKKNRQPGTAVGLMTIHDNFDDPLPDEFMATFSA